MFVCRDCFVLSGRGLCDEMITRPEESYWMRCVVGCGLEKQPREWGGEDPLGGYHPKKKNLIFNSCIYVCMEIYWWVNYDPAWKRNEFITHTHTQQIIFKWLVKSNFTFLFVLWNPVFT